MALIWMLVWKFLILMLVTCCYCTIFTPCQYGIVTQMCDMICETPDLSKTIDFKLNGSFKGSCSINFGCGSASLTQRQPNITVFSISSLSYANDIGEWTCTYDGLDAPLSNFIVYGNSTHQNVTSIPESSKEQINEVDLTIVAECVYPSNPILKLSFRLEGSNDYKTLLEKQTTGKSANPSQCNDYRETVISEKTVVTGSSYPDKLPGKTVYLKVELLQTRQNIINFGPDIGPFSFIGCDYSDAELFLCGFSLFLIEFVVTIVIVSLLKWKMIIGGFTKLKVIVSCAFLLVALIIGIILGVVLLECSKRNLSLGLGLGLGFLLAAAHLVTIYVIEKKCEKDPKMAPPKINVPSRFKEVSTFEKGEPVVIKIPFTGNPKPTVKWLRDGVELKGRRYGQEVTERHAILTIKVANKEDDGPYHLILENELGTDSAVLKIQVNDDDERKGTPASTSKVEFTE